MSEALKTKLRCVLDPRAQTKFFLGVQSRLGLPSQEIARLLHVHPRTLNTWVNGRASIPLESLSFLATRARMRIPKHKTIAQYSWTSRAGLMGGMSTLKKYGRVPVDPKRRVRAWEKWYAKDGVRHLPATFKQRDIFLPERSEDLAEFCGILLGDGHVAERQVTVTLHEHDDRLYASYVTTLMKKLFRTSVSIYPRPKHSVVVLIISRTRLVTYLSILGLPKGNKISRQADIPSWIKKDSTYTKTCVRGLMDTDGSVYQEVHHHPKKDYPYPRMSFVSHSAPLRSSVLAFLKKEGIHAVIRNNRSVNIERLPDIIRYFKVIGSNNPKHLVRYGKFIG
jgi:intein/homing endonuclease